MRTSRPCWHAATWWASGCVTTPGPEVAAPTAQKAQIMHIGCIPVLQQVAGRTGCQLAAGYDPRSQLGLALHPGGHTHATQHTTRSPKSQAPWPTPPLRFAFHTTGHEQTSISRCPPIKTETYAHRTAPANNFVNLTPPTPPLNFAACSDLLTEQGTHRGESQGRGLWSRTDG